MKIVKRNAHNEIGITKQGIDSVRPVEGILMPNLVKFGTRPRKNLTIAKPHCLSTWLEWKRNFANSNRLGWKSFGLASVSLSRKQKILKNFQSCHKGLKVLHCK
jgi:hypothetical protein